MSDVDDLMEVARIDWLLTAFGRTLHGLTVGDPITDHWWFESVQFACGLDRRYGYVPGMFTRMGAKRCFKCCDKLGLPHGTGSPRNDPECRKILGLRELLPIGEAS